MGIGPFKSCSTNSQAVAPDPNPRNWTLLDHLDFDGYYILVVKYDGCTNFEGIKIMVFKGKFDINYHGKLDPHFQNNYHSPVARFKPDENGIVLATFLAQTLSDRDKTNE